jgi:hypothetical protein
MKLASASSLVAIALALAGCVGAPAVKMSKDDLARTKTIRIVSSVQMPDEMFFQGRAQSCAMAISGAVAAAACPQASKEPKDEILDAMKANGISLPEIVRSEFQKTVTSRGLFTVAGEGEVADADLALAVNVYGLGQTQGFSKQNTDFVTPQNSANTGGHEFQQYLEQPQLLRATWANVAQIVSGMLVDDLAKKK